MTHSGDRAPAERGAERAARAIIKRPWPARINGSKCLGEYQIDLPSEQVLLGLG
jgi:hypothetical protein